MTILTVVIPVFDHYIYLKKCLNSIIKQRNGNFEVVCVNDGSTDFRVHELLDYMQATNNDVKVIHNQKNLGIAGALNQGIEVSEGLFIGFVDCDDFLPDGTIDAIINKIIKNPEIDYFFSDRYDIDENDEILRHAIYGGYSNIKPGGNIKDDLINGMIASHFKVIRKSMILDVNGFDSSLNGVQDWDLALKIADRGNFYYIREPLYYHRIHQKSVTQFDKVSQFRKTNIVRRKFIEQRFKLSTKSIQERNVIIKLIDEKGAINPEDVNQFDVEILSPGNISLETVNTKLRLGKICLFDARSTFQLEWINFLREYNSYFDLIIVDDPRIAVSLMGYVYSHNIIKFASHRYSDF